MSELLGSQSFFLYLNIGLLNLWRDKQNMFPLKKKEDLFMFTFKGNIITIQD